MATLLSVCAHGPDEPTDACLPLHFAVTGSADAGIAAAFNLVGVAAVLIQDPYLHAVQPIGVPPRTESIGTAQAGIALSIGSGCAQTRGSAKPISMARRRSSRTRSRLPSAVLKQRTASSFERVRRKWWYVKW
ncbi:MAG: hypothetical protein ACJ789_03810 [Thermomicrobiales bacterium]